MIGWVAFIVALGAIFPYSGFMRRIVHRNAPFYAWSPNICACVLLVVGFFATSYIGYQPDPIDQYQKAAQTAAVADICYVGLMLGLFFSPI